MHDVHWLAEKSEKSQTLQVLFMHSAWTIAASLTNVCKKKKKKTPDAHAGFFNPIQM